MGFSDFPPRFDLTSYTNSLAMWLPRADAAITHVAVPWDSLLLGVRADSFVIHHFGNTTSLYRSHGFTIYFVTDVTDGLNRQAEAPSLIALGRSITEPAIQVIYRGYVLAVDTLLHPDYLGLAAETNLIKAGVAPAVYAAVVTMTNAAAADVRAVDAGRKLFVSVQVETAWGRLGNGGAYIGIAQDYADFPFIDAFGLSSYPYLGGYADPADIPDDYYSRLIAGHTTPVMVVEGGWSSGSAGTFVSDPAKQARYLQRHRAVLAAAHAIALFQLDFADFDTTGLGLPPNSTLSLFTQIGIVTADLVPKPALAIWDSTFAWPRVP